jgi:hypothetical protein
MLLTGRIAANAAMEKVSEDQRDLSSRATKTGCHSQILSLPYQARQSVGLPGQTPIYMVPLESSSGSDKPEIYCVTKAKRASSWSKSKI